MLLIQNHRVIVPVTGDIYVFMPNRITTLEDTERGAVVRRIVGAYRNQIPVNFDIRSVHFLEVYEKAFRPYRGYRIINYGGFHSRTWPGLPWTEFAFRRNRTGDNTKWDTNGGVIEFNRDIIAPLTVIYDTIYDPLPERTNDPAKRGAVFRFDNFASYDWVELPHNPGRYAGGNEDQASISGTGEWNKRLRRRALESQRVEPVVLTQPLWGYARLTKDRQGILYVPYRMFQGTDAFTYTLITQTGQIGEPKVITVDVYGNAPPISYSLTTNKTRVYVGGNVTISLHTVSVPVDSEVFFEITGDKINSRDFNATVSTTVTSEINYNSLTGIFLPQLNTVTTDANRCDADLPLQIMIDTDRDETFTVKLQEFPTVQVSVDIVYVTLRLYANTGRVAEGDAVRFTLQHDSATEPRIPNGSSWDYIIIKTPGVDDSDFVQPANILSGTFHMINGFANVEFRPRLDGINESARREFFTLKLLNGPLEANVEIVDTLTPLPIPTPTPIPVPVPVPPAAINYFFNGDFEIDSPVVTSGTTVTYPGWTIFLEGVRMNGASSIFGFPTPNNPKAVHGNSPSPFGDAVTGTYQFTWAAEGGFVPGSLGNRVLKLRQEGRVNQPYGIVRGPYIVSNQNLIVTAGDKIVMNWRAEMFNDEYDVFAYLIDPVSGKTILLLNEFGLYAGWQTLNYTIGANDGGQYRFVFIAGSYDASGGQLIGANFYLDNINLWQGGVTPLPVPTPTPVPTPPPAYGIQGDGTFACPPSFDGIALVGARNIQGNVAEITGTVNGAQVWGNNTYGFTSDSDLRRAAVHAGLITAGQTANIRITSTGFKTGFPGSTSNGITSLSYTSGWCAVTLSLA